MLKRGMTCTLFIFLLVASCKGHAESQLIIDSSDLKVSVEYTPKGNGTFEKRIKCEHSSHATSIATETELSLLTSVPCNILDAYHTVASVDIWSQSPNIVLDLEGSALNVSGNIDAADHLTSYLAVSWESSSDHLSCSYKCLARGIDKKGQAVSLTKTLGVKPGTVASAFLPFELERHIQDMSTDLKNVSNIVKDMRVEMLENKACEDIRNLDSKLDTLSDTLSGKLDSFEKKFGSLNANIDNNKEDTEKRFKSVENDLSKIYRKVVNDSIVTETRQMHNQLTNMDFKIDQMMSSNESELVRSEVRQLAEKFEEKFHLLQASIVWSNMWSPRFDFSSVFKGKIYISSKAESPFDIHEADKYCAAASGYLVELDDDEEFFFVREFVMGMGGVTFFTGTNDIDVEGSFVHRHSGTSLKINQWSAGQPDDAGGNEDCVEIRTVFGGYLNDFVCNAPGKYVCEVPFPPFLV